MKKRLRKLLTVSAAILAVSYLCSVVVYNTTLSANKKAATSVQQSYDSIATEQKDIARKLEREKYLKEHTLTSENLLRYTNKYRAEAGLNPLALNSKLNLSAQRKADKMASLDFWDHKDPNGAAPWHYFSDAGYSYEQAGENLACGYDDSEKVVDGWFNSPTHKANLLKPDFTEVGFGIVENKTYTCGNIPKGIQDIVVQHFGIPYGT